ncbi:MAG: FHA domain-containing protein [Alphaproteobacteria bacterium]|nr:FHA domain-containing protein [Alphaproteobacteria bacterium]MCB9690588.1 FHA domain-containing protein [Alphaproteobacteria bacterium]
MLEPGDQIHHYIVEARVGGGGTASVYRVRHAILQHALALKILDPDLVDRPDMRRRFLAEGRIQARVRHPAIVMVTDAVVDAPRRLAGLVMEYVEGPNLAELVARMKGPPDAALFRALVIPILEALHHGHQEGVVHRDVKPSNILLSRDAAGVWHPRLVDFGIAHVLEEARLGETPRVTEPDGHLGTPAFMAPEQIDGGVPSPLWDVFAMGCVMYELATGGVHPFERPTVTETLAAIGRGTKLAPSAVHDGLDAAIEDAILAALEHDPAARARSCMELIERLDASRRALAPAPVPREPAPPTRPVPPTFIETTGSPHQRKAWRLTGAEVRIGRQDVEVALGPVAELENVHCVLRWTPAGWVLENLADAGTRVNGARVTRIPLEDGDLLRVGHQVLKFHTTPDAGPPTSVPANAPKPAPAAITGPRLEIARRHVVGDGPDPLVVPVGPTPVVLGRDPGCSVQLDEPLASPKHCRIVLQGLDVVVEDLSSHSGTWVDGQRVRFRKLREGTTLVIGEAKVRYRGR